MSYRSPHFRSAHLRQTKNGKVWVRSTYVSGHTFQPGNTGSALSRQFFDSKNGKEYGSIIRGYKDYYEIGTTKVEIKPQEIPEEEREKRYIEAKVKFKTAKTPDEYRKLCEIFKGLGSYRESEWYYKLCKSHYAEMSNSETIRYHKGDVARSYDVRVIEKQKKESDMSKKDGIIAIQIKVEDREAWYSEAKLRFKKANSASDFKYLASVFKGLEEYKSSEWYYKLCLTHYKERNAMDYESGIDPIRISHEAQLEPEKVRNYDKKKDDAFEEESRALKKLEARLESTARSIEQEGRRISAELSDYFTLDYEDVARKQDMRREMNKYYARADEYRKYMPSPYFARMDFDVSDGNEESVYIGKEGFRLDGQEAVIDWRSPVGQCFYMKTQREFHIGKYTYTQFLRRALDVQQAKLISCVTEFDGNDVTLDGEVIDPFLLTVLKDKRRQHRLTDIIRTIQENQNSIIRRPKEESFIVQGCAGSGKTMILLHRLSYLKFNHREMSFASTRIITPNPFFDAHINELSRELGLDEIKRFSVEEYYAELIHRYSPEIQIKPAVRSEKALNTSLLEEIYSEAFAGELTERYRKHWQDNVNLLGQNHVEELMRRFEMDCPELSRTTSGTCSVLRGNLASIVRGIERNREAIRTAAERVKLSGREAEAALIRSEEARNELKAFVNEILVQVEETRASSRRQIEDIKHQAEKLNEERKKYEKALDESRTRANSLRSGLELIQRNRTIYTDAESIETLQDSFSQTIIEALAQELRDVHDANTAYAQIPVYNFGKRNRARMQMEESKERFAQKAKEILDHSEQVWQDELKEIDEQRQRAEEKMQAIISEEEQLRSQEKQIADTLAAYEKCAMLFEQGAGGQIILNRKERALCGNMLQTFESKKQKEIETVKKADEAEKLVYQRKAELQRLQAKDVSLAVEKQINACVGYAEKLTINAVLQDVLFETLREKYAKYGQKYAKENYRHKMMLTLLMCSLYYDRKPVSDNFLHIDEAQDLSIAEYRLLKRILGERCIFNLYGDVNQAVYGYKGISDWEEIREIAGNHVYQLNENYRNTQEITQFCNQEFGAEVIPIGIKGEAVIEAKLADAVRRIIAKKRENPKLRAAILFRYGLYDAERKLRRALEGQNVSWFAADDERISVLSVEMAKGLEFDAVVAIVDRMSVNERYVSYTRALESLIVVRESFDGAIVENAEESREEYLKIVSDPDDEMRMITEHEESEEVVAPSEETWETIAYDKLVRDRIPEIIRADGAQCETEVLTEEAYIAALDRKIDEELAEYRESHAVEELADLMEVIYALAAQQGCSAQKLEEIRMKKQQERGGFSERCFLKTVKKKSKTEG